MKKKGEKKKAKTTVTWPDIKCEGFRRRRKSNAKVPVYNFNKLRRSERTCYFGPQPKVGALGIFEYNPIDEGEN